jgi:hypothetical protein
MVTQFTFVKVRTEENIDTVQRQMEDKRQLSLRQLSQQTELTMATCQQDNTGRSTGDSSLFVAIF